MKDIHYTNTTALPTTQFIDLNLDILLLLSDITPTQLDDVVMSLL